jgi:hypothetical protein
MKHAGIQFMTESGIGDTFKYACADDRYLALGGGTIGDSECIQIVNEYPDIHTLDLTKCAINCLNGIQNLTSLRTLRIIEATQPIDIAVFPSLPNLRELSIYRCYVDNTHHLIDLCPNITHLHIQFMIESSSDTPLHAWLPRMQSLHTFYTPTVPPTYNMPLLMDTLSKIPTFNTLVCTKDSRESYIQSILGYRIITRDEI